MGRSWWSRDLQSQTVFDHPDPGIVGSNLARNMDVRLSFFCAVTVLCSQRPRNEPICYGYYYRHEHILFSSNHQIHDPGMQKMFPRV
jgi:hypothetical protein